MGGVLFSNDELQIIKNNYGKIWVKDLIKLLPIKRSEHSIISKANSLGLSSNQIGRTKKSKNNWTDKENTILQENFGKIPYNKISALLPIRTAKAVAHQAKKLNLSNNESRRTNLSRFYRQKINDKFFKENTSLLPHYYAGLLAADGYITKNGNQVNIDLTAEDREYLELFKINTQYEGKIYGPYLYITEKSFKNIKPRFRFAVTSKEWVEDLQNIYNIINGKSLNLQPPNIQNQDEILAFIAGYIDGDGAMNKYKIKSKSKKLKYNQYLHIMIVGSRDMLLWIKSIVDKLFPRKNASNVTPLKKIFSYRFAGTRAEGFAKLIKALHLPLFKRKWDKANA